VEGSSRMLNREQLWELREEERARVLQEELVVAV
jgi:hypothetical protein